MPYYSDHTFKIGQEYVDVFKEKFSFEALTRTYLSIGTYFRFDKYIYSLSWVLLGMLSEEYINYHITCWKYYTFSILIRFEIIRHESTFNTFSLNQVVSLLNWNMIIKKRHVTTIAKPNFYRKVVRGKLIQISSIWKCKIWTIEFWDLFCMLTMNSIFQNCRIVLYCRIQTILRLLTGQPV